MSTKPQVQIFQETLAVQIRPAEAARLRALSDALVECAGTLREILTRFAPVSPNEKDLSAPAPQPAAS